MSTFCSDYYKQETHVKMYSGLIFPVGNPEDWDCPGWVREIVVNPPVIHTPAGRPRSRRIHSGSERRPRRQQKCSNCQQFGHNRVNCMASILLPAIASTSRSEHSSQLN